MIVIVHFVDPAMSAGALGSLGQIWNFSDAICARGGPALCFLEHKLGLSMSIRKFRFHQLRVFVVPLRKLRWCTGCSIHGGLAS